MAGEKVKFDLPSGVANGGDDDVGPVRMFRTFSDPGEGVRVCGCEGVRIIGVMFVVI